MAKFASLYIFAGWQDYM